MKDRLIGHRLVTHIALRLMIVTVFLATAIAVQPHTPGSFPIDPFFLLVALVYAASLGALGTVRSMDRHPWLLGAHIGVDATMVAACVLLTGGVTSLLSSLFFLPIVAASTIQVRRGAMQAAALSSVLYGALVGVQYLAASGSVSLSAVVPAVALPPRATALYTGGLNVFGFFAVALLGGSLSERLRRADVRLERASEEIADLQAFNQHIVENLVSGLATADAERRVLTFNPSAVLITGHELSAALGASAETLLQLPQAYAHTLEDPLSGLRNRRTDIAYRRADGRLIDIGIGATRLPLPDGRLGYMYTFQDVTEARRLEREAQLQQRLAAVGEMAAGIAHEIRNPLASISGSMQILRDELELTDDQSRLLDIVLRESDRLNETIRSFLAYARPQRLSVECLDLRRTVRETAILLRNSYEVDVRHSVEVPESAEPVMVEADEHQVRQIVWNLATNALRAMPQGGRLILTAIVEREGHQETCTLSVRDEGVGIPPEDLEGIFQPFRGAFGKGTGLGLAIVHRLVSGYGGHIEVQSSPGRGTTFRVSFPSARIPPAVLQVS